jgi:hypothetical protein
MAFIADRTCLQTYELRPQICLQGGGIAQNFNMPLVHFAHSCKALHQALCVKFAARGAMEGGRDDTPPQPCLLDGNNLPQGQNTACSIARAFVILAMQHA